MNLLIATGLISLVLGFGSGMGLQKLFWIAADKERIENEAKTKENNKEKAHEASVSFEEKRTANEIRYRTVTVTVEKLVDRPVYINQCLDDDGLRTLNEQITRQPDSSKLGLKLPKS